MSCERCEAPSELLYAGECDACVEQAWWDYQESRVG
jgi:hypothetical protein